MSYMHGRSIIYDGNIKISENFTFSILSSKHLTRVLSTVDRYYVYLGFLLENCTPFAGIIMYGEPLEESLIRNIERTYNSHNVRIIVWKYMPEENLHINALNLIYENEVKKRIDKYIKRKLFIPSFEETDKKRRSDNLYKDYMFAITVERSLLSLEIEDIKYLVKRCEKWYLPVRYVLNSFKLTPEEQSFLKKNTQAIGNLQDLSMLQLVCDNKDKNTALPSILDFKIKLYKIKVFLELCKWWRQQE